MKRNVLTNVIIGYCGLLLAAVLIFALVNNIPEKVEKEPEITGGLVAEISSTPSPLPATAAPTPSPVVIEGPETWQQFANQIDFDWEKVSDKPAILFRKPAAADSMSIKGFIASEEENKLEIRLENCLYTEFYYSSLERRANGHYYNSQPPVLPPKGEGQESTENPGASTSVNDIYSDPLRGLGTVTLKEKTGSYSITVKLTLDANYSSSLYETRDFYLIVLNKGQN